MALGEKPCCTILVDLKASDMEGPLSALQHTLVARKDMLRLVADLNEVSKLGQAEDVLNVRFDQNWKALESHVANAISEHQSDAATSPDREVQDIVEENLLLTRSLRKALADVNDICTATQHYLAESLVRSPQLSPGRGDSPIGSLGLTPSLGLLDSYRKRADEQARAWLGLNTKTEGTLEAYRKMLAAAEQAEADQAARLIGEACEASLMRPTDASGNDKST